MQLNQENLTKFLHDPALAERYLPFLEKYLPQFEIDTPEEQVAFLAQTHHESWGYTRTRENMHYRNKEQLLTVFKKYFGTMSDKQLKDYIGEDQKIGNLVYANRLGNGNVASGDGYKYRGAGLIQLTGRTLFTICSIQTGHEKLFAEQPEKLATPEYAVLSACWYWKWRGLDQYTHDYEALTKAINGALNGYAERVALLKRAQAIFL